MCHFCGMRRRDLHLEDLAPVPFAARQPGGSTRPEPVQMTGPNIRVYLRDVGDCLRRKGVSITVVGVGGVLTTMALGTRATTHDVDFMWDNISPDIGRYLQDAIRKTARKHHLESDWLNNQTILHVPPSLRVTLQQDAIQQGSVVLEEPGFKMLAAPWMYCFVSKLHRIAGQGASPARNYDPADAANFLSKHLERSRRPAISVTEVKSWLTRYEIRIRDDALPHALAEVNGAAGRTIIIAG